MKLAHGVNREAVETCGDVHSPTRDRRQIKDRLPEDAAHIVNNA